MRYANLYNCNYAGNYQLPRIDDPLPTSPRGGGLSQGYGVALYDGDERQWNIRGNSCRRQHRDWQGGDNIDGDNTGEDSAEHTVGPSGEDYQ